MGRHAETNMAVNRSIFEDVYAECCETEAERMILDVIIAQFWIDNCKGKKLPERTIAKITGLSKSGVRQIADRAAKKVKKVLKAKGINSADDILNTGNSRSDAGQVGSNAGDETDGSVY